MVGDTVPVDFALARRLLLTSLRGAVAFAGSLALLVILGVLLFLCAIVFLVWLAR